MHVLVIQASAMGLTGIKGIKKRNCTTFTSKNNPSLRKKCRSTRSTAKKLSDTGNTSCVDSELAHCSDADKVNKCWTRLDHDEYAYLIKKPPNSDALDMVDSHGTELGVKVMRPRATLEDDTDDTESGGASPEENETYRIFNMQKVEDLWNIAITGHKQYMQYCCGRLVWDYASEKAQGLCWSERLRCKDCGYTSQYYKLFQDIRTGKKGRPAGDLNIRLQVGLSHTMISNSAIQRLLAITSIPPPSTTGLQHQANKVGDQIVALNEKDMRDLRIKIKDMNEKKGLGRDAGIRAAIDSKYNTKLNAGRGKTPFQPSTQSTCSLVEHESGKNWIVGVDVSNKLCAKCSRIRKDAEECTHDGTCSATLPLTASIGDEQASAKKLVQRWDSESALTIDYVTSDGDSHAAQGIADGQGKPVINLLDTRHFGEALGRNVEKLNFDAEATGCTTAKDRLQIMKLFALNVKRRVNAEWKTAYNVYTNNLDMLINKLSYAVDAIVDCYSGNCGSPCENHSFACSGGEGGKRWCHQSYLENIKVPFNLNEDEKYQLRQAINVRLGPHGIKRSKFNTNTQFNEAANRAYTAYNPQQVTMSRNAPSRVHAAAHKLNFGLSDSIKMKLQYVGTPMKMGTRAARALKKLQQAQKVRAETQKSSKAKQHIANKIKSIYNLHRTVKEKKTYEKDMQIKQIMSVKKDHSYAGKRHVEVDHAYDTRARTHLIIA